MIRRSDNEIRNKVMRGVKFQQMKRQLLHDFMRKQKEKILNERNVRGAIVFDFRLESIRDKGPI